MSERDLDPRLHRWLDDEMSADERRSFERALRNDPELSRALADLDAQRDALRAPAPEASPELRARILDRLESERPRAVAPWWWAGGAVAAALLLAVWLGPWNVESARRLSDAADPAPARSPVSERPGPGAPAVDSAAGAPPADRAASAPDDATRELLLEESAGAPADPGAVRAPRSRASRPSGADANLDAAPRAEGEIPAAPPETSRDADTTASDRKKTSAAKETADAGEVDASRSSAGFADPADDARERGWKAIAAPAEPTPEVREDARALPEASSRGQFVDTLAKNETGVSFARRIAARAVSSDAAARERQEAFSSTDAGVRLAAAPPSGELRENAALDAPAERSPVAADAETPGSTGEFLLSDPDGGLDCDSLVLLSPADGSAPVLRFARVPSGGSPACRFAWSGEPAPSIWRLQAVDP